MSADPADKSVSASLMARMARLWIEGGGSVQSFVAMAETMAVAEADGQTTQLDNIGLRTRTAIALGCRPWSVDTPGKKCLRTVADLFAVPAPSLLNRWGFGWRSMDDLVSRLTEEGHGPAAMFWLGPDLSEKLAAYRRKRARFGGRS